MKYGNPKQKLYTQALTKALLKESDGVIPENEARLAAQGVTQTLLKSGDSLNLQTVRETARYIMQQKTRYEDGELVYVPGEGVIDQVSGEQYRA